MACSRTRLPDRRCESRAAFAVRTLQTQVLLFRVRRTWIDNAHAQNGHRELLGTDNGAYKFRWFPTSYAIRCSFWLVFTSHSCYGTDRDDTPAPLATRIAMVLYLLADASSLLPRGSYGLRHNPHGDEIHLLSCLDQSWPSTTEGSSRTWIPWVGKRRELQAPGCRCRVQRVQAPGCRCSV